MRVLSFVSAAVAMAAAPFSQSHARLRVDPAAEVGTVLVAHGADSTWNDGVLALAGECRTGGPVAVAFLMGDAAAHHRFQDAVAQLVAKGATRIVVVPLLVSSHSGHYEQIRWLVGATDSLDEEMRQMLTMSGIERPHTDVPLTVTTGMDDAPELAHILATHALALTTTPKKQALFLVGHGPNTAEEYAAWMDNLRPVADSVRAETGFRDVKVGLVRDDAPDDVRAEAVRGIRDLIDLQARVTKKPVVVVPVLLSRSSIGDTKFRHDLADLPISYSGQPILPSPDVARWVEHQVRDAVAQAPTSDAVGAAR
jgi:sirohydrochlorin cobaltochelatase